MPQECDVTLDQRRINVRFPPIADNSCAADNSPMAERYIDPEILVRAGPRTPLVQRINRLKSSATLRGLDTGIRGFLDGIRLHASLLADDPCFLGEGISPDF